MLWITLRRFKGGSDVIGRGQRDGSINRVPEEFLELRRQMEARLGK
jgi:hypothetical protein